MERNLLQEYLLERNGPLQIETILVVLLNRDAYIPPFATFNKITEHYVTTHRYTCLYIYIFLYLYIYIFIIYTYNSSQLHRIYV